MMWEVVGYGSPQENFPWANPEVGRKVSIVNFVGNQWVGDIVSLDEAYIVLSMNGQNYSFPRDDFQVFKASRRTVRKELPCVKYF